MSTGVSYNCILNDNRVFWDFKVNVSTSEMQFWYYIRMYSGLRWRTPRILKEIFEWLYGNENAAPVPGLLCQPSTSTIQRISPRAHYGWRWNRSSKTPEIKANHLICAFGRTQPLILWRRPPQTKQQLLRYFDWSVALPRIGMQLCKRKLYWRRGKRGGTENQTKDHPGVSCRGWRGRVKLNLPTRSHRPCKCTYIDLGGFVIVWTHVHIWNAWRVIRPVNGVNAVTVEL